VHSFERVLEGKKINPDFSSERSRWQIAVEFGPDNTPVSMDLSDCSPVQHRIFLFPLSLRSNLLANIELCLFL
jgi:hypothetical protein